MNAYTVSHLALDAGVSVHVVRDYMLRANPALHSGLEGVGIEARAWDAVRGAPPSSSWTVPNSWTWARWSGTAIVPWRQARSAFRR